MALEEAKKISNIIRLGGSNEPSPLIPLPSNFAKASSDEGGEGKGAGVLEIRMDSELIVRQMQGRYKIKEPSLKLLAADVFKLIKNFQSVTFHHVRREQNKEADKLVNEAIDESL